jgi:hypothetical protein
MPDEKSDEISEAKIRDAQARKSRHKAEKEHIEEEKKKRLKDALRNNLKRRKAQGKELKKKVLPKS